MIDLKDLKEKFDLKAAFKLGPPKEYAGDLDKGEDVLERIDLVLTQTFDAIGSLPFRQLIVKGEDKKVVIIYYRNNFFGILADTVVDVEKILKYIYQKESQERKEAKTKEKKTKIEEEKIEEAEKKEEARAEEEKEAEIKEEKVEEEKEVSVSQVVLDSKIMDEIEEIAGNYLGDFSLDIVSNVIEDSGVNKEEPTKDQVLEVVKSLKDAASLIIGPSKAKKLKEDIMKKIEEGK
jgi:hypothetical protein